MPRIIVRRTTESSFTLLRSHGRALLLPFAAMLALSAVSPCQADAQLGAIRKLKKALTTPDTARAAPDSTKPQDSTKKLTGLQKALSTAVKASDKFQQTTGMSVKDAALAASGAGAASVAAKKMGLDPSTLAATALNKANVAAQQKAATAIGGVNAIAQSKAAAMLGGATTAGGVKGAAAGMLNSAVQQQTAAVLGGVNAAAAKKAASVLGGATAGQKAGLLNAVSGAAAATGLNAVAGRRGAGAVGAAVGAAAAAGPTATDAQLLIDFQTAMMQATQANAAGDATGRAKVERWQKLSAQYQPQILQLSQAAAAGDVNAVGKMQALQIQMIREWLSSFPGKATK